MKKENKLKSFIAILGMSATLSLLGKCGETDTQNNVSKSISLTDYKGTEITYDENGLHGAISYANLEAGHVQIVHMEYNGKILEPKLMAISTLSHGGMRGRHWTTREYIDLKTGVTQISYTDDKISLRENFTIVEEISLFDFIIEENWLQDEFDINELIKFYEEKVKNKIEEQKDRETSTLSRKKYQNI